MIFFFSVPLKTLPENGEGEKMRHIEPCNSEKFGKTAGEASAPIAILFLTFLSPSVIKRWAVTWFPRLLTRKNGERKDLIAVGLA